MKILSKISLRLRLTILTAITLTVICVLFTLLAVITARDVFKDQAEGKSSVVILKGRLSEDPNVNISPDIIRRLQVKPHANFKRAIIVYMLLMIVSGTGVSYIVAGSALKPVTRLSKKIEDIDESRLFEPLEGFDANDEVSRLATSFNHMILKQEKAYSHQKRFAANAAHELKTPLASIIANIEVLQIDENPTTQEYNEVLNEVMTNAGRLNVLINDLLKMNSMLNIENLEHFDAKSMFEDIISAISDLCSSKNVSIENHITDVQLYGDPVLLNRAFFNVIQNAVKYNKNGGKVEITAEESNDCVTVHIKDTGIGIASDKIENIFEPFYCVDASRSRELGGSGLGLSIVKSIVEKHRGRIEVQSEIGEFTNISLILPKN